MTEGQRIARLRNYLNNYRDGGQDSFWPLREWPEWARTAIVLAHKKRSDRFNLMFFLLGNGLDPYTAASWVLAQDYVGGRLKAGQYDDNAMKDILGVWDRHNAGTLYKGDKKVFDMTLGRAVMM